MTFEEMLRQGMSVDEIMNKLRTQVADADAKIKAEAETKRKTESETRAKALVDVCNRAISGTLTAEDVAYIQQLYAAQKYPKYTKMLAQMLTAEEVDNTISIALAAMDALHPLLDLFGLKSWDEMLNSMSPEEIKEARKEALTKNKKLSDDQILHNFIKTLQ